MAEQRKLFPFLNPIRESVQTELNRRRREGTAMVSPFARFTSIKEDTRGQGYRYFHLGMQGSDIPDNFDSIFELSFGMRDVVGFGYRKNSISGEYGRVPITLEEVGEPDIVEGSHPVPGITNIRLEHKGPNEPVFWEVTWIAHNVAQLNFLRQHFMVAGTYVALEYGQHYSGLDGDVDDLNSQISQYCFDWAQDRAHEVLFNEVKEGRANVVETWASQTGNNYDIWIGIIVDYEMTIRSDGSYECVTRAFSTGEALFSLSTHTPFATNEQVTVEIETETGQREEEVIDYKTLIQMYFQPAGGLELLIKEIAEEQGEAILVFDTTSTSLTKELKKDEELGRKIVALTEVAERLEAAREQDRRTGETAASAAGRGGVRPATPTEDIATDLEIEEFAKYFGDANWFVRWQTFVDRILPDLFFWFDRSQLKNSYIEKLHSMNYPTYAELSGKSYVVQAAPIPGDETTFITIPGPSGPMQTPVTTPSTGFDVHATDRVGSNRYLMSTNPNTMILHRRQDNSVKIVVNLSELEAVDEENEIELDATEDFFGESNTTGYSYLSTGVWLNVNAIQEAFLSSTTFHQAFLNLLRKMNAATGNYWNLDLVYDEEKAQFNIVDRNLVTETKEEVKAKTYQFNRGPISEEGAGGELLEFSFNSTLSKEMKAVMMLSGPKTETSGYGTSVYGHKLNRVEPELTDLFAAAESASLSTRRPINTPPKHGARGEEQGSEQSQPGPSAASNSTQARSHVTTKKAANRDLTAGALYRERIFENFKDGLRKYVGVPEIMISAIEKDGKRQANTQGRSTQAEQKDIPNAFIAPVPTELSMELTIRGISGLAFHDVFIVDKLPDIYTEHGVFLINGLSHIISAEAGWTTSISGIYYFMWPDGSGEPIEETQSIEELSITPTGDTTEIEQFSGPGTTIFDPTNI